MSVILLAISQELRQNCVNFLTQSKTPLLSNRRLRKFIGNSFGSTRTRLDCAGKTYVLWSDKTKGALFKKKKNMCGGRTARPPKFTPNIAPLPFVPQNM